MIIYNLATLVNSYIMSVSTSGWLKRGEEKKKIIAGEMKETENPSPVFVAVRVVKVFGGRASRVLVAFCGLYSSSARQLSRADETPARGVGSLLHPFPLRCNLSRLFIYD